MRLIFIRHAEPDYEHDSLTEKGWREAKLLARRTKDWQVDEFYVSPLGRARDTASFTLRGTERQRRSWTGCTNFRARCRTGTAVSASAGI